VAGLDPAIHEQSDKLVVKIVPVQVLFENELNLPRARPVLDVLLPLPCQEQGCMVFDVNKTM
jgi:hypothetical protein